MNKTIITVTGGIAALTLGATGLMAGSSDFPIQLDVTQAAHVGWDKPTTDQAWADDVKKENFDIKSDGVLMTMRTAHAEKLDREIKAFAKYERCPECMYEEKYQQFLDSGMDDATAQDEAAATAQTEINQRAWSIEKLAQSVERMDHELDLRTRGVVITATDATGKARKPADLVGKIVRTIND